VLWLLGAFDKAFAAGKAAAPQPGAKAPAAAPKQRAKTSVKKADMLPAIILAISTSVTLLPFYRWKMAKRTCYALTNRRALVYKQGLFGPTRESYSPVEVAQMRRRDSWVFKEGGDLIFKSVTVVSNSYSRQHGARQSVKTTHYGFLAIAQVKKVEKLVRETLIDRFVDKLNEASSW
jgi:hypothetical protein